MITLDNVGRIRSVHCAMMKKLRKIVLTWRETLISARGGGICVECNSTLKAVSIIRKCKIN